MTAFWVTENFLFFFLLCHFYPSIRELGKEGEIKNLDQKIQMQIPYR